MSIGTLMLQFPVYKCCCYKDILPWQCLRAPLLMKRKGGKAYPLQPPEVWVGSTFMEASGWKRDLHIVPEKCYQPIFPIACLCFDYKHALPNPTLNLPTENARNS